MRLTANSRLGSYQILGPLGAGGMGEVYKARDTRLDRMVAIKVLPDALSADPERLARFEREAKVLASLNHPNIAQIYGVEESAGGESAGRGLVMELVPGEPIQGPLPLDAAFRYARQIAEALEAAHEKGIVHRDLKPANILLTPEGVVKVLDFGLASISADPGSANPQNSPTLTIAATRAGTIMGTAAYMSPEQARGKPADRRADIWAFGAILYEMLTGKPLFGGETVSDILVAVLGKPPDLSALPARARPIVERCLRQEPRQRWQAIGDVRIALEEPEAITPAAAPNATARLPWAVAGVFAIVAAAATFVAWRANRSDSGAGDAPLIRLDADLGPDAHVGAAYAASLTALSPDGARLLYPVRGRDGKQMLASRALDKAAGSSIPGTEYGGDPFFSPDGQWIGFFADGKLKKISLKGGPAINLADASNPRGATWNQDGSIVAALTNTAGLYRVSASGGSPQPLTKLGSGEVTHRWPEALPGGQAILFTSSKNVSNYEGANVEAVILATGERRVLREGAYFGRYAASGHLLFVRNGVLFALRMDPRALKTQGEPVPVLDDVAASVTSAAGQFDLSRTGVFAYHSGKAQQETWSIAGLDAAGRRKTQPELSTSATYITPRFSPDGKRLAMAIERIGLHVYTYDFEKDVLSRLTFFGPQNYNPVWMPDGRHIVFRSVAFDTQSLFWIRSDGAGEPQKLLESKSSLEPHSISSDGRRVAYQQGSSANYDIWILPLDLTDPEHPKPGRPEPFAQTPASEVEPAFSPDGRWMAYSSDESGAYEVYVRPFPDTGGGGKWQISSGGGRMPTWSRQGKSLFFENPDNRIMVTGYEANGSSFSAAKPRLWSEQQLLTPTPDRNFDVAPDGSAIEALVPPPASAENKTNLHVTFLLNFFGELRRRAGAGAR